MTREITVRIKTDHDDTLRAVQSLTANLARAGYVVTGSVIWTADEKPEQQYKFVTAHALLDASEIDLHMEQTREEARDDNSEEAEARAVGSHGMGEEAEGDEAEGLSQP